MLPSVLCRESLLPGGKACIAGTLSVADDESGRFQKACRERRMDDEHNAVQVTAPANGRCRHSLSQTVCAGSVSIARSRWTEVERLSLEPCRRNPRQVACVGEHGGAATTGRSPGEVLPRPRGMPSCGGSRSRQSSPGD